jgi:hypothetical protein
MTLARLPREPELEKPSPRVWRDWVLAAVVGATVIAEVLARDDLAWRAVGTVLGVTLAATMLWRRTHPLAMVTLGFGAFVVVDLASYVAVGEPFTLYAGTWMLVLVYALGRWGTGRQVVIGSARPCSPSGWWPCAPTTSASSRLSSGCSSCCSSARWASWCATGESCATSSSIG